jgi:hypothetical protein
MKLAISYVTDYKLCTCKKINWICFLGNKTVVLSVKTALGGSKYKFFPEIPLTSAQNNPYLSNLKSLDNV